MTQQQNLFNFSIFSKNLKSVASVTRSVVTIVNQKIPYRDMTIERKRANFEELPNYRYRFLGSLYPYDAVIAKPQLQLRTTF